MLTKYCIAFLILFCCTNSAVKAQDLPPPATDSTPAKCRWDLNYSIFENVNRVNSISYAKSPFPWYCIDAQYAKDGKKGACIPQDTCLNDPGSLIYDVYYPSHDYNQLKLPAVILFHGGGFGECPQYNQQIMRDLCSAYAKRGFVTFNVEYRRGRIKDKRNDAYASAQHLLAVYRGIQDCKGAIRSIIKRERQHDSDFPGDPYRIDTNKIFVGGVSAGGLMTLTASWYTNQMIYQSFPTPSGELTIQQVSGPVDAGFYYGDSTIVYKPLIKGIHSMWGAIAIPFSYNYNQQNFFTQNNPASLKPVIAFHGTLDSTFPYYMNEPGQNVIFSPPGGNTVYNSESRCLFNSPFHIDEDPESYELISASSLNIYTISKIIDSTMPVELYVDCQMDHGLDTTDGANFHSDFGTGLDSAKNVTDYMVKRAATFFQAIMNGKTAQQIGPPSKFTECENMRKKCATPDNPNDCNNNDECP